MHESSKLKFYILTDKLKEHEGLITNVHLEIDPERLNSVSKTTIFAYN